MVLRSGAAMQSALPRASPPEIEKQAMLGACKSVIPTAQSARTAAFAAGARLAATATAPAV